MKFLEFWLTFGLGVYSMAAIEHRASFKGTRLWSWIKGFFLGVVLWPVCLWVIWFCPYNQQFWDVTMDLLEELEDQPLALHWLTSHRAKESMRLLKKMRERGH